MIVYDYDIIYIHISSSFIILLVNVTVKNRSLQHESFQIIIDCSIIIIIIISIIIANVVLYYLFGLMLLLLLLDNTLQPSTQRVISTNGNDDEMPCFSNMSSYVAVLINVWIAGLSGKRV